MDPITQGALGAALPQSVCRSKQIKTITWLGCFAGMAPDLDVFILSPTDPLLFLEYHRQFTHSLAFIPFGALFCCLLAYRWSSARLSLVQSYLVCLLGYGTHALLDACTTYGTQLFWPFTDLRIAWNNVSVVDPMVTIPLLTLVIIAYRSGKPIYSRLALAWVISYLLIGVLQRERAEALGRQLAASRGHQPLALEAKPGFASLILWKIIYEYEDHYYVDAIRTSWQSKIYVGSSIRKLDSKRDLNWLPAQSQQAQDLTRFAWFSDQYLALDKDNADTVIDIRYSILPNEIKPLWGIKLDPLANNEQHVQYFTRRDTSAARLRVFWSMLTGQDQL